MKRKVCEKCGAVIDQDTVYCQSCGHKVEKATLRQEEVKKNIFGLFSVDIFLLTLVFFTFLPMVLEKFHITFMFMTYLAYIGYSLSIICEIAAIIICKRDKTIDKEASGVNYGSATMLFSFLMIIAKVVQIY